MRTYLLNVEPGEVVDRFDMIDRVDFGVVRGELSHTSRHKPRSRPNIKQAARGYHVVIKISQRAIVHPRSGDGGVPADLGGSIVVGAVPCGVHHLLGVIHQVLVEFVDYEELSVDGPKTIYDLLIIRLAPFERLYQGF